MARWLIAGDDGRFCVMDGEVVVKQGRLSSAEDAPDLPVRLRINHGPPDKTPTAVGTGTALPAVTQDAPPDMLDGWARLMVAGAVAGRAHWDGIIVVMGDETTHWVHLSAEEIVSFQGFVTGRLRTALGGADRADAESVEATLTRPERIAAHLHVASLGGDGAAVTGHLIGAEIAAAKPYWLGQEVIVVAEDDLLTTALAPFGVTAERMTPADAVSAGVKAMAKSFS